jgi:outer membrane protein assembly factor BamB
VYVGCTRDAFFALDAATGQVKWRIEASGWASAPALADGTLYFGGRTIDGRDDTYIYAVDQASGNEKWRVPIQQNGLQDRPVVVDGMLFASTWRDGLLALDAGTGNEKWRYTTGSALLTSPAVVYGTVYITDEGRLIALDMATGQQ